MPRTIESVAHELAENLDLPEGYRIWWEDDNILIGTERLAFVVTRKVISDNLHIQIAKVSLASLIDCHKLADETAKNRRVFNTTAWKNVYGTLPSQWKFGDN